MKDKNNHSKYSKHSKNQKKNIKKTIQKTFKITNKKQGDH